MKIKVFSIDDEDYVTEENINEFLEGAVIFYGMTCSNNKIFVWYEDKEWGIVEGE